MITFGLRDWAGCVTSREVRGGRDFEFSSTLD